MDVKWRSIAAHIDPRSSVRAEPSLHLGMSERPFLVNLKDCLGSTGALVVGRQSAKSGHWTTREEK